MESNSTLFVSAYWANAVPDHIEDSTESIQKLTAAVERVIQTRRDLGNDMHISRKGWVKATAEKFGLTIVNALGTALTIKDNVINEHAREVRLYKNDQLIADRIRTPLETALRKAWDDPTISRTVIISHSMGTFISYDVLWRFSHRPEPQYSDYRTRTLTHLITMGSPLGRRSTPAIHAGRPLEKRPQTHRTQ